MLDIANSVRNDDFSNMSIDIYYFDALAVYKNSCGQYCDAAGSGFIIFGQCGYGYSFFGKSFIVFFIFLRGRQVAAQSMDIKVIENGIKSNKMKSYKHKL